tara:strand:+ start:67118 stop:68890 length:1773 start_codon:yes stop_codon:yes gene_type:complete
MTRRFPTTVWLCGLIVTAIAHTSAYAQPELDSDDRTAIELLPASCLAVVEMQHPDDLLTTLSGHNVWKKVKQQPQYQEAISNPGYMMFLGIRTHIETQIGMKWREAYDTLLGGGITIAFHPETEGLVALVRSTDAAKLQATAKKLIELGRADAHSKGNEPLPEEQYRDITIYGKKNARFAVAGPWLIMTNKDDLGKKILDSLMDGSRTSIKDNEKFAVARQSIDGEPAIWSWIDLGTVRDAGLAKGLDRNQTENPIAELLVGGVLTNLRKTPYFTASLYVSGESTRLQFSAPHENEWVEEFREYWFGPDGNGTADAPLETESTILSISTYRKVSEMWLRAGDLFDERMNDELAKADANLTTFFAGKDFGEDVLGSFGPTLQILVNRQNFEDVQPKPALRLPSFALAGHLEKAEETQTELRRTFQSFVGFLNVIGAMQGNPQLDQDIDIYRDNKIYTASFIPEPDEKDSERARIQFNFSPTLAFAKDRFFIASTKQMAKELIDAAYDEQTTQGETSNTAIRLKAKTLGEALADNRDQLVAQNMIKKGQTREESAQEIGLLLEVLNLFKGMSFDIKTTDGELKLELAIQTKS